MFEKKWIILAIVTLFYFFLNVSTFNTLGVALHTMLKDLGWSYTEAFFSYTVLGVACGLGSLLPAALLKLIGARWSMTLGGTMLAVGFLMGAATETIMTFYIAMGLVGCGFALSGNVPGVWAISEWFSDKAPRFIGFYLMAGAAGAVVGPTMVEFVVSNVDWRVHWMLMAVAVGIITVLAVIFVRELGGGTLDGGEVENGVASETPSAELALEAWTAPGAMLTPAFAILSLAFTLNLLSVTTIHSVALPHLEQLGSSARIAAFGLGMMSLIATVCKGVSGHLCERYSSRLVLAAGSGAMGVGTLIFTIANHPVLIIAFAAIFGIGWGLHLVGSTVMLLDYYGRKTGTQLLGIVHIFATIAAAGPLIAGRTADAWGTFSPIFYFAGITLILSVIPVMLLRKPEPPVDEEEAAEAVPSRAGV